MRVPDDVLFSTVRITTVDEQQRGQSFGTGFLCRVTFDETKLALLLISNRHVLGAEENVVLHFHEREADRQAPALGGVFSTEIERLVYPELYVAHPDEGIDLACLNLSNLLDPQYPIFWRHLFPDMFATFGGSESWNVGDEVAFVGYPDGRFDATHNLPLVRTGHIASMPRVDFNDRPQLVIDAQVFPGSSGSPVLGWEPTANELRLLGVVTETMIRHERLTPVEQAASYVQMIGLGIVIKATKVQELIHAVVSKARTGFVPQGGIELRRRQSEQPTPDPSERGATTT